MVCVAGNDAIRGSLAHRYSRRVAPLPRWEQSLRERAKTDEQEDAGVDRGPKKAKRGTAFEKLQREREAKGVEEDLQRDAEEREEREQVRQEEREERKREREKARGQESS